MHARWTALVFVLLSTACASSTYCSLVGCTSQVIVNVRPYAVAHEGITRSRVCAGDSCRSYAPPRFTSVPLTAPTKATDHVEVRVIVDGPTGSTTIRTDAVLRTRQPNGPHCSPTCHSAGLQLSRTGELTAA